MPGDEDCVCSVGVDTEEHGQSGSGFSGSSFQTLIFLRVSLVGEADRSTFMDEGRAGLFGKGSITSIVLDVRLVMNRRNDLLLMPDLVEATGIAMWPCVLRNLFLVFVAVTFLRKSRRVI